MTDKKISSIRAMIGKECCRNSLTELCFWWDVTAEEYEMFLEAACSALGTQREDGE
jgi:hypothetical protein